MGDKEIRSAFDLALIVVDECSRVLFDRSRIQNKQPNLVDIFSHAIQEVVSTLVTDLRGPWLIEYRHIKRQLHSISS